MELRIFSLDMSIYICSFTMVFGFPYQRQTDKNENSPRTKIPITKRNSNLSCKNHRAASLLNLLLGDLGHKLGLHHNRLILRQDTLAQNLEITELRDINQWNVVFGGLILHFLRDQGPDLVDVDNRAIELVAKLVEVTHTDFTEITRVILIEENPVVVHTSGVSPTTRMLSVFADSTMAGANVSSLLPVLLETSRHGGSLPHSPHQWLLHRHFRFPALSRLPELHLSHPSPLLPSALFSLV